MLWTYSVMLKNFKDQVSPQQYLKRGYSKRCDTLFKQERISA